MTDTAFIALYRGRTVGDARLVAVSSDRSIVERFFHELVGEDSDAEECSESDRDAVPSLALAKREN